MTMRRTKRYTVQSFKKKELTGDDPYRMKGAPKGLLECPECHSVYFMKRWSLPGARATKKPFRKRAPGSTPAKAFAVPQPYLCPACQKMRDRYAEGFLSIQWPNWHAHKADILNLIHNEEARACRVNPLERVMGIRTRGDGVDIETTTEHMAQRLGRHLERAFKGEVHYHWSHKDKLARIEWLGPAKPTSKKRGG